MRAVAGIMLASVLVLTQAVPDARADDTGKQSFVPVPGNSFISNFMNSVLGTRSRPPVTHVAVGGAAGGSGVIRYVPITTPLGGVVCFPGYWNGRYYQYRDPRCGLGPQQVYPRQPAYYQVPARPVPARPAVTRPVTRRTRVTLEKGLEMLAAGEYRHAAQELRKAAVSSGDAVSLFWFGQALVACGEYEYAYNVLSDSLTEWPTWLASGVDPAYGFGGDEQFDDVLHKLEGFVEEKPDQTEAQFVLAYELFFARRFKEAAKLAGQVAATTDDNEAPRALFSAASCQLKLQEVYKAAEAAPASE